MHFDMDVSFMGEVLKERLLSAIKDAADADFTNFYSGMAIGFDILAAEAVLREKQAGAKISLVAVVPFNGQDSKWSAKWRKRHNAILEAADKVIVLRPAYARTIYYERNRYLVDNSARLIGFYNGKSGGTAYTFDYAKDQETQIVNLWDSVCEQDPLQTVLDDLGLCDMVDA